MRDALIRVDEIPLNGAVIVHLLGREILVMMLNGKPRAFANVCMHHGGPLARTGDTLTCQWHGARYEARTGRVIAGPVRPDARLIMLPTRVDDGVLIYVYDDSRSEESATSGQTPQEATDPLASART
jgi:nitrite reductase/ring-hydroxylating ferredoxin subunit